MDMINLADEKPSGGEKQSKRHYWIYAPGENASYWEDYYKAGIMGIGWHEIGNLMQYKSRDEMKQAMKEHISPDSSYINASLATWQFVHDLKPGDIVFAKKGKHTFIGCGEVTSEYYYDESDSGMPNIRKVSWIRKGEWYYEDTIVLKTLTDITWYQGYGERLLDMMGITEEQPAQNAYTPAQFLSEVYMDENDYKSITAVLKRKKNIILQGAPGVGKTYAAKRLAYSLIGSRDDNRVQMIQFHQSYSYEDFIEGYRPDGNGFTIRKGSFYEFCRKADSDRGNDYYFIIDEINRGNLSRIFGELFMLIEADKRGVKMRLLYSDTAFSVPPNVYIIGMMNTADRSIAMLDYALRRRFSFICMKPGFDTEGFRSYCASLENERLNSLTECVKNLNKAIAADPALGGGFCIGHSYFCGITKETIDDELKAVVEYELIPLISEYWYDEADRVREWSDKLRSAVK